MAAAEKLVIRALEDIEGDAKAALAYVLGLESYVYGFPLVMMDTTKEVIAATSKAGAYSAPINQLFRMRGYVSPVATRGGNEGR